MYNLSTRIIKDHIIADELFKAILETSATLEELLFSKLVHDKEIPPKLIDNWTLGRLIEWVKEFNLIMKEEKYYPLLKEFAQLRNLAVHSGEFIVENLKREQKRNIYDTLREICGFIGLTPVNEDLKNPKKITTEHFDKQIEKKIKFLNKYENN